MSLLQFVIILSMLSMLSSQESDSSLCGYFVYDSMPYPLNYCMTSARNNSQMISVMYRCENDEISYNQWNNGNCSGIVAELHYDHTSSVEIYNCDGPYWNSSDGRDCDLDPTVSDIWYDNTAPNTTSLIAFTHSDHRGRQNEEIAFIVGAGAVLVVFWTCYFYNKCCKMKLMKQKMAQEIEHLDLHHMDHIHERSRSDHDSDQTEQIAHTQHSQHEHVKPDRIKHNDHDKHLL